MKIFIGGSRGIKTLDSMAIKCLTTICNKNLDILIGDCYGVDTAVQKFCADVFYNNVTIFACNGKARNNIGRWKVEAIHVPSFITGPEFYRQKDIAMAEDANCGFMIWDGESKATYRNIMTLLKMGKFVSVYQPKLKRVFQMKPGDEMILI